MYICLILMGIVYSNMVSKSINIQTAENRFSAILKNHVKHRITKIFHEYQNKNHEINTSFVSQGANRISFNLKIFHFNPQK